MSDLEFMRTFGPPFASPPVTPEMDGWTVHEEHLSRLVEDAGGAHTTTLFVEVGAYLGKTSVRMLEKFPLLNLLAIDTWKPFGVQHERAALAYETWWANVWPYRDRAAAIHDYSHEGMVELSRWLGDDRPDVVYIDAGHAFHEAFLDVSLATALWPGAAIAGDDWPMSTALDPDDRTVGDAVEKAAKRVGKGVFVDGRYWELRP